MEIISKIILTLRVFYSYFEPWRVPHFTSSKELTFIGRGSRGTGPVADDDTPFPRCKLSETRRACVSYIIDKRPYRASCRYLTGLSPASPPVSIIPSHDFSYRDPLANAERRNVIPPSKLPPLSSNFEIRCNDRISLSLSACRRSSNLVRIGNFSAGVEGKGI